MALTKITTGIIADGAITSDHLASGAVTHSSLSGITTDNITEGSTNLYYADSLVGTYISGNRDYGNITTTGYIAGPATFTIDPAAVGDNTGTVVIAGNLQVDGTTTTINSTTMEVDDLNITLASGAANAAAADGAGITVDGASATITYDGTNDEWDFNKDINVTGTITADGLTVDTNTLYVDSTNNRVGIGVTSILAGYKLEVDGSIVIPSGNILANRRADGGNFGLIRGNDSGTTILGDSQSVHILSSGNVGIGVISPNNKLEVDGHIGYSKGTNANRYLLVEGGDGTWAGTVNIQAGFGSTAAGGAIKLYGHSHGTYPGSAWIGRSSSAAGDIMFGNGGTGPITSSDIQMVIDSSGKVGIGTTNPSTQLHVYGSNNSAGDLWTQVGAGNIPSITIQNAGTTDNNNAALFFRNDSGMFAAINARFRNHTTDETELRFSTTNSSGTTRERMKLDGDGDIQVDGRLGYIGGRHRKAIYHFQDTSGASGSTYYAHFKTNISTSSNTMTRWEFEGYNYGDAKIVRADWAVHTSNGVLYAATYNSLNTGFQAANIYASSDNYVVIVGSYTVRYYLSGAINVHDSPIYSTQASSITAHTITTSNSGAY